MAARQLRFRHTELCSITMPWNIVGLTAVTTLMRADKYYAKRNLKRTFQQPALYRTLPALLARSLGISLQLQLQPVRDGPTGCRRRKAGRMLCGTNACSKINAT